MYYRIVARCDAYNSSRMSHRGRKVLKTEGGTPVLWVEDDNYGDYHTEEAARARLDGMARRMAEKYCNLRIETPETLREGTDLFASDSSWFVGEGVYTDRHEAVYVFGRSPGLNDGSISYYIDTVDETHLEVARVCGGVSVCAVMPDCGRRFGVTLRESDFLGMQYETQFEVAGIVREKILQSGLSPFLENVRRSELSAVTEDVARMILKV